MACSRAWPTVWPKFRIMRRPLSRSSLFTTPAFMRIDAAITFSSALASRSRISSRVLFHEAHQRAVADDAGLHAFHQAGAQFAVGQRAEHADVGKDGQRMMEAADKIFALRQIHAGFAADA